MALEYALPIDAPAFHHSVLACPGVIVTTIDTSPTTRDIIRETYAISPAVTVVFRLDKFEKMAAGRHGTILSSLHLLQDRDGILVFNGKSPVLLSKAGELTLNCASALWQQATLMHLVQRPFAWSLIPPL